MDKVVIAGVFDFVNFHVCKALLDKGIEVKGIQIETEENDNLDEKRLEVGRNANFTEASLGEITKDIDGRETFILSIYDLYMCYKEDFLLNENFINKGDWNHFVILVPSQVLTDEIAPESETVINDFIRSTIAIGKDIHLLYLPTIYGPWQPDTFLFQHSILNGMNRGKTFRGLREETCDVLYVKEAVESIIKIIEDKRPGRYLLQSGMKNQWDICASFLGINERGSTNRIEKIIEDDDVTKLTVQSFMPIPIALTKQIDHAHRLFS
jgi:nucleoside-diphosphate-sugar epimerase